MATRFRKISTITLAALLLTLNFAIQFAHTHDQLYDTTTIVQPVESDPGHAASSKLHELVCIACHCWLSQGAVIGDCTALKLDEKSSPFSTDTTPLPSFFRQVGYHLRAPPA